MLSGKLKIALIAERKSPPDRRVAFSPEQCLEIQGQFPQIEFIVEPSEVRCIPDFEYLRHGIRVSAEIRVAEVFFGIKEVPVEFLYEGSTYFFFSHTIKKQPHNRNLLKALLKKRIEMVDYECLLDKDGNRTVAFGRFAGIVGAYNALRMWLEKKAVTSLPPATHCRDMDEMLEKVRPFMTQLSGLKISITGTGRVGSGAVEVMENLGIPRMEAEAYLSYDGKSPVYCILSSKHYMRKPGADKWDESEFRLNPEVYQSDFIRFADATDLLISCHYWNPKAPPLFSLEDIRQNSFRISVISDVTCDINGSIPTTIRASIIANPFYDVQRKDGSEAPAFSSENNLTVCAVDNLPCELPLDASIAFGEMLEKHVIPELVSGDRPGIDGATICRNGVLLERFGYLQEFADQAE